jgi:uncharacterized membrane protein YdbT with pleckstrin-like domain
MCCSFDEIKIVKKCMQLVYDFKNYVMRLIEMESLCMLFDRYELCARVIPSAFVIIPPVISCYLWFPQIQTIYSVVIGVVILILIVMPMSQYVRDEGRRKQKVLYERWGGVPTTAKFRCLDKSIDSISKKRYKKCLENSIDGLIFPSEEEEEADHGKEDEIYNSAVRWLREKTRNKEYYPLVFEENINYGFLRNLWAVKPLGLFILVSTLFLNICAILTNYKADLASVPKPIIILILILLGALCLWIGVATEKAVHKKANIYAETLLASCDHISFDQSQCC